jgi:hypothetical protein
MRFDPFPVTPHTFFLKGLWTELILDMGSWFNDGSKEMSPFDYHKIINVIVCIAINTGLVIRYSLKDLCKTA